VAYALAGRIDIDFHTQPLGTGKDGKPVFLRDVWPTSKEVADMSAGDSVVDVPEIVRRRFRGDERWNSLPVPEGDRFVWESDSTYIRRAPYFDGMPAQPGPIKDIAARARSACWATVSPPTTSRRPARSARRRLPGST